MNDFPEAICPLCSRVKLRERLHSHIADEHPRLRAKTVELIQAYHGDWAVEDGACEPCWRSFRDAGRVLSVLKQMQPRRPDSGWKSHGPAVDAAHEHAEESSVL